LEHGQVITPKVRDLLKDLGEPLPLPQVEDLDLKSVSGAVTWRNSSMDAKRMTRLVPFGNGVNEVKPKKDLPLRSSTRVADIQRWQTYNQEQDVLRRNLAQAERVIRMHKRCADLGWKVDGGEDRGLKYLEPIRGVSATYFSTLELPEDTRPYLASLYDARGEQLLWHAPQSAISDEGFVMPMDKAMVSKCHHLLVNKDKNYRDLKHSDIEVLAWRWLIISHNYTFPMEKVKIPKELNLSYDRGSPAKADKRKTAMSALQAEVDELKTKLAGLGSGKVEKEAAPAPERVLKESDVRNFLTSVWETMDALILPYATYNREAKLYQAVEQYKTRTDVVVKVAVANDLLASSDDLAYGKPVEPIPGLTQKDLDLLTNVGDSLVEAVPAPPPDSYEEGGHLYILVDDESQASFEWSTLSYRNGSLYHRVTDVGEGSSTAKPASADKKPAPSKKDKGKGKEKAPAGSDSDGGVKLTSKPETTVSSKKKTAKKEDPIAKGGNPLRAKGVPRSTVLTEEQRDTLRKTLGIVESPVSPTTWATLSKKDKRAETAKRTLPKWAVTAVTRNPGNLAKIVSKELTKDNFREQVQPTRGKPTAGQKPTKRIGEATSAWAKVREEFPSVGLFARPRSKDEKALKQRYDALVKEYGKLSCFPRVKQHPSQQGKQTNVKDATRGGKRAGALASSDFAGMLKLMSDVVRAVNGRLE
jgi:hypothetical protein